jgi:plastocyanin
VRTLATGLFTLAVLAVPSTAGAATANVWLGEQARPPKGTPKGATLNQFFPRVVQIRAGDKVRFTSATFHTASYLAGQARPGLATPDPAGGKYDAVRDFLNAPFWFNGLTKFIFNPAAFGPVGNSVIRGNEFRNSGVITPNQRGKPQGVTFTFPKAGKFKLVCLIHPGMSGTVVVKPKGRAVTSRARVLARAKRDVARAWTKAQELAKTPVPANTVYAGVGRLPTALLSFLPAERTIRAGETVTWVLEDASEVHNVAFGEPTWMTSFQEAHELLPFGPNAPNQFFPIFIYGSEPPGPYTYTVGLHGNGFLATPLMDKQPGEPPNGLPGSFSVKFPERGKFHYFCQIHGPDMSGDIIVT